jgi:putative transcriptional regulator
MNEDTTTTTEVNFDDPPRHARPTAEEKARLAALADEDIARAAQDDPDNPVLTAADLAAFKSVADAKLIRRSMNLTQEAFAHMFHIPIGTLRDWEQHRTEPDQAAQNFLKVVSASLDAVKRALSG